MGSKIFAHAHGLRGRDRIKGCKIIGLPNQLENKPNFHNPTCSFAHGMPDSCVEFHTNTTTPKFKQMNRSTNFVTTFNEYVFYGAMMGGVGGRGGGRESGGEGGLGEGRGGRAAREGAKGAEGEGRGAEGKGKGPKSTPYIKIRVFDFVCMK